MAKKNTWGGKRTGAGRPFGQPNGVRKKTVTASMDAELLDFLRELTGQRGKISHFIERAIRDRPEFKAWRAEKSLRKKLDAI